MSGSENTEAQLRPLREAQLRLLRLESEFYRSCLAVQQSAVELREMQTYVLRELWETEVERRRKLDLEATRAITELKRCQEIETRASAAVKQATLSSGPNLPTPSPCSEQPQHSGPVNQPGSPRPANQISSPRPANRLGSPRLDTKSLKGGMSLCLDRCRVSPSRSVPQTMTGPRVKQRKRRVRVNVRKKKREGATKPEEGGLKLTEVAANEVAAVPWVDRDQLPAVEVTIVGDCLEVDGATLGETAPQDQPSLLLPEARDQREMVSPTWSDGELTMPLRRGRRKRTVVVLSSSSSRSPSPESLSSVNRQQQGEGRGTVSGGTVPPCPLPLPSKNDARRRKSRSPVRRQSSTGDSTVDQCPGFLVSGAKRTTERGEALTSERQEPSLSEGEKKSYPTSVGGSVKQQPEKGDQSGSTEEGDQSRSGSTVVMSRVFHLASDLEDPHRDLSPEIPLQGDIASSLSQLSQRQGKRKQAPKKPSKEEDSSKPSPRRANTCKSVRPKKHLKESSAGLSSRGPPKRPWDLRSDDQYSSMTSLTSELSLTEKSVTVAVPDSTLPTTKKRKTLMSYKKSRESTLTIVEEDLPNRRTTLVVNTHGLHGPKLKPKT